MKEYRYIKGNISDKIISEQDVVTMLGEKITQCLMTNRKLLIYGNGGFSSIANHIEAEYIGKFRHFRKPLATISLCSNASLITCIGNDFGFERIFSRQIEALADSKDVVIGMTTSGKSKNIFEALYSCEKIGCESWIIMGNDVNPIIKDLCANIISINANDAAEIQDKAICLFHRICGFSETNLLSLKEFSAFEKVLKFAKSGFETLLLDRDGVINNLLPNEYVLNSESIVLNKDFLQYVQALSSAFKYIFVVTNQKCVGKGLLTKEQLDTIHKAIIEQISAYGGRIDDIFSAVSDDLASDVYKPQTGLSIAIKEKYVDVDFDKAIMIGDSYSDYLFAKRIGSQFICC